VRKKGSLVEGFWKLEMLKDDWYSKIMGLYVIY
jgi:hypothetical protein